MTGRQRIGVAAVGGVLLGAPALAADQDGAARSTPSAARIGSETAVKSAGSFAVPETPSLRSGERERIEERWGIRIEGLRLTAGGYMLDFRFRVIDPVKAEALFDRKARPVLTDERSGTVMMVPTPPKTGPLRSANDPKEGRTYFMFFANPGRFIQPWSPVTVAVGAFSVSGLVVK